jgi:hypothetical protein
MAFSLLRYAPILVPLALVILPACAALAGSIAEWKRRKPFEGYALGLFLGPIGVIVEGTLPGRRVPSPPAR